MMKGKCIMKKSKLFAMLTATMLFAMMPLQVTAAEMSAEEPAIVEEVEPLSSNLIATYTLNAYYGYNTLMVDSSICAFEEMAKLGMIDIVVQHSSDKINWVDEVEVDDMINEDAYYFSIKGYGIPIISGYYYRIKVTLYAKEHGWFFPDTHKINVTSNSVWIG